MPLRWKQMLGPCWRKQGFPWSSECRMIAPRRRALGKNMSLLVDDTYCEDGLKEKKGLGRCWDRRWRQRIRIWMGSWKGWMEDKEVRNWRGLYLLLVVSKRRFCYFCFCCWWHFSRDRYCCYSFADDDADDLWFHMSLFFSFVQTNIHYSVRFVDEEKSTQTVLMTACTWWRIPCIKGGGAYIVIVFCIFWRFLSFQSC